MEKDAPSLMPLWDALIPRGKRLELDRGQVLLRQGERDNRVFVVRSGLLKAFYQTLEGNESIKSFLAEGEGIASLQAVAGPGESTFGLQALEPASVVAVPGERLMALQRDPALAPLLSRLLLNVAMKKERREYELLCLSAERRYALFCQRSPALLQRVTQADIARHLGVTPVALSRIRKRLNSRC